MKRSKSGLLASFLEDEDSLDQEDIELLLQTLEKSGNIVTDQRENIKSTIKKHSDQLENIIIEENIRYFQYIKEISIR